MNFTDQKSTSVKVCVKVKIKKLLGTIRDPQKKKA